MAWLKIEDTIFIDMSEIETVLLIEELDCKEAPIENRGKPAIQFGLIDRDFVITIDEEKKVDIDTLLRIIELCKCDRSRGTLSTKTIIDFEDFLKEKV